MCNAVLAFLLLASLSSLIFPIGLEAIKPTSKLKIKIQNSAEEFQSSWNFISTPVLHFKLTAFKQFKY